MKKHASEHKPLLLIFPHNVMAHYLRCLQLCNYLKPYFDIQFNYSSKFHSYVTIAGFDTFECPDLDAEKVQQCITSFDFSWLNEPELKQIYEAQVNIINQLNPTAVLGDMSPTLRMAAEKTRVLYISLINGYMSRYYAFVRPMPARHPLHALVNLLPHASLDHLIYLGEALHFRQLHRPFKNIRKHALLSKNNSYLQELEGDLNLVCDLPELFPQKNLPLNYLVIPPLFHRLNYCRSEIKDDLDPSKKTLYLTMGSTGNWKDLEFMNEAEFKKYNIITAGDNEKILRGANVFSYTFIDSEEVFEITDLVICHGGNGTIYQALSFGIPVLCKTAHVEQEYNADGLQRVLIGESLDQTDREQYAAVIEKWINKKNSKDLLFIKDKISESIGKFEQVIESLLNQLVAKNLLQHELLEDVSAA